MENILGKDAFPRVLYHYCSNNEFFSIITKRALWLSSISLSTDSMEGKLVARLISGMAETDKLSEIEISRLKESMSLLDQLIDALGFCLSEEGDLLSQWRAHAEDASGVSIGFSKDYLERLSVSIDNSKMSGFMVGKVIYDRKNQEELIRPTYDKIKEHIKKGAFKMPRSQALLGVRTRPEMELEQKEIIEAYSNLHEEIFSLLGQLFFLKTNAFREEKEWRLISYLSRKKTDDPCLFRPSEDKIIPYRKYYLSDVGENPISEVILGPKNMTPECFVESFLVHNKFNNVRVLRSEASYR